MKHFQLADDVATLVRSASDHGLLSALALLPDAALHVVSNALSQSFQAHSYVAGVTESGGVS